jgi:hypothetical protein
MAPKMLCAATVAVGLLALAVLLLLLLMSSV